MAEIPPWLNVGPTNYLQATEAGSQAGLRAGEIATQQQEFAARNKLEQQRMAVEQAEAARRQALVQAQMGQNFQLSTAEMQMRRDIAAQNTQRMLAQQQMLNAYRQAQVGLGQDRLQQAQQIHEAKARDEALAYRDEQGFANAVANGMTPQAALFQFPRTRASIVSAMTRTGAQESREDLSKWKTQATAAYRNLQRAQDDISSFTTKTFGEEPIPAELQNRLNEARSEVQQLVGDKSALQPPPPAVSPEKSAIDQKIAKANELRKLHPDWSKDKIIGEVNKVITGDNAP